MYTSLLQGRHPERAPASVTHRFRTATGARRSGGGPKTMAPAGEPRHPPLRPDAPRSPGLLRV